MRQLLSAAHLHQEDLECAFLRFNLLTWICCDDAVCLAVADSSTALATGTMQLRNHQRHAVFS